MVERFQIFVCAPVFVANPLFRKFRSWYDAIDIKVEPAVYVYGNSSRLSTACSFTTTLSITESITRHGKLSIHPRRPEEAGSHHVPSRYEGKGHWTCNRN